MLLQVKCVCDPEAVLVEGRDEAVRAATERVQELGCACDILGADGSQLLHIEPQLPVQRGSPPTTYAVLAAIEGEPGSWERVAFGIGVRALPIAVGMFIVGVRGWRLPVGALLASSLVTGMLFAHYGARKYLKQLQAPVANGSG